MSVTASHATYIWFGIQSTLARMRRLRHTYALSPHTILSIGAKQCVCMRPCCVQTRYSKSVESVVKALVDDTSQLARQTRSLDTLYSNQQVQLQDTKEALLR